MEEQVKDLQEYADAHCGGDRYKAIYELMSSGQECALDPYVDGMTREDANFTYYLLREEAIAFYGGTENFRKAIKAETLAAQLEVSLEDAGKTNPFKKKLLIKFLLLLGAVLLPAVLMYALKQWQMEANWISFVQSVLIGICSLDLAEALVSFFRFRKMQRLYRNQKTNPESVSSVRPFEEYMAGYKAFIENVSYSTREEAEESMNIAAKKNRRAFGLWFVFAVITFIACMVSGAGTLGCVIGCAVIIAFTLWQMRSIFRPILHTRDMVSGVPADEPAKQALEKRQSLCVLAMMGIGALYLLVGAFGVALCISLAVR